MRNHPYGLMLTIHKNGKFGDRGSYYQPPNTKAPPATANSRLTAIHPLRCARTERTGHGQTSAIMRTIKPILMVSSWLLHVACDFGNLLHHVVVLCCFLLTACIPLFHLEHPCGFNLTSLCPKRNHMVSLNMVELLLLFVKSMFLGEIPLQSP